MMYETGNVTSLKDLAEAFLTFAQKSNTTTQAWELVDNRLDSFYGATLKIPKGDDEGYYVSLMFRKVTKDTYCDWFRGSINNYLSENVSHDGGTTKYGSESHENLFADTGQFVAIGLHTLFDEDLWMAEQPQITCEYESTHQPNEIKLIPELYYHYVGHTQVVEQIHLPVYPCTGCPWLTISDSDIQDYNVAVNGLVYYFTKTDYNATITFRTNNYGYPSNDYVWQSISFGRLETLDVEDAYKHPLYIGGGNQALQSDFIRYTPPHAKYPITVPGTSYRLSLRNIGMSNANILHPTKFCKANMSNFRVLIPEGVWVNLYAHEQKSDENPCNLLTVDRDYGAKHNSAYTMMGNSSHMIDTYTVNERLKMTKTSTPLNKIYVVIGDEESYDARGVLGYVPNCFGTWTRTLDDDIQEINGKKYLSVPCGWKYRLWDYEYNIGFLKEYFESTRAEPGHLALPNMVDQEQLRELYDSMINPMYTMVLRDRLLIPLED